MMDPNFGSYSKSHVKQMINAIEQMTDRHDKNRDGLDFMEMYTASGGRLQDL